MRRFGMLIVYLVVAAAVFIAVGSADLRSQRNYAKKNGCACFDFEIRNGNRQFDDSAENQK